MSKIIINDDLNKIDYSEHINTEQVEKGFNIFEKIYEENFVHAGLINVFDVPTYTLREMLKWYKKTKDNQNIIDKAIKYIEENKQYIVDKEIYENKLLSILRGENNDNTNI